MPIISDALAPITLVTGGEPLLCDRAVTEIAVAARRTDPDTDVSEVPAPSLTPGMLAEQVSPSLFATRRVLVVRDVQDASDELSAALRSYASDPSPEVHLVLLHPGGPKGKGLLDALRKSGVRQVGADKLTRPEDQVAFVRAEMHGAGRRIEEDAARRLVEAVGGDLRSLSSACSQLAADAEGAVTVDLVQTYFDGRAEVKGWAIAELAVEGRTAKAVEELHWALETGTAAVLVVGALGGSLRTLGRLGSLPRGAREADVARELSVPPWKLRTLRTQLRGWTPDGLGQAVAAVAAADVAVKGGANDNQLALTRMILDVGRARSAS